jgi:mono/diheme cytochrome c family protein
MKRRDMVMQGWWFVLFFPLVVAAAQGNNASSGNVETMGHQLYVTYCSACHGMEGRGNGPIAPELRTPPADLTQIAKRRGGQFPVADIAAYIDGRADVRAHGTRDMPVWGEQFGEQVGGGSLGEEVVRGNLLVLVNYLQSIQR